jgi:hypothetical protein
MPSLSRRLMHCPLLLFPQLTFLMTPSSSKMLTPLPMTIGARPSASSDGAADQHATPPGNNHPAFSFHGPFSVRQRDSASSFFWYSGHAAQSRDPFWNQCLRPSFHYGTVAREQAILHQRPAANPTRDYPEGISWSSRTIDVHSPDPQVDPSSTRTVSPWYDPRHAHGSLLHDPPLRSSSFMDHQDAYDDPFLGSNVQEACKNFCHSLLRTTCLMSKSSTGLMSNSTIQSLVATNSDGYRLMHELVALVGHDRLSPLLLRLHDLRRVCALQSVSNRGGYV